MTWCDAWRRRFRDSEDAVRRAEAQRDMAKLMRHESEELAATSAYLRRRNGFGEAIARAMGAPRR